MKPVIWKEKEIHENIQCSSVFIQKDVFIIIKILKQKISSLCLPSGSELHPGKLILVTYKTYKNKIIFSN